MTADRLVLWAHIGRRNVGRAWSHRLSGELSGRGRFLTRSSDISKYRPSACSDRARVRSRDDVARSVGAGPGPTMAHVVATTPESLPTSGGVCRNNVGHIGSPAILLARRRGWRPGRRGDGRVTAPSAGDDARPRDPRRRRRPAALRSTLRRLPAGPRMRRPPGSHRRGSATRRTPRRRRSRRGR